MLIFPAIDLYEGKAVRLYRGNYEDMTVYSDCPKEIAEDFISEGATAIHLVDLEGAKYGTVPNLDTVASILSAGKLFSEVGGGIRSMEVIDRYLSIGIDRVILGTAAVTDPKFTEQAAKKYGAHLAVGVDIKDGAVAIRGWTERSEWDAFDFCKQMQEIGIETVICTDVSKDGAMQGTNLSLYREMANRFRMNIVASGGVSSMEDVKRLREMELYGAIIGKAYYTGAISLKEAIEVAK